MNQSLCKKRGWINQFSSFDKKVGKYLILLFTFSLTYSITYAQTLTVKGTVRSADQAPFPGVTVRIKGTTQGTTTGADGTYIMQNVPSDATLTFSAIGFVQQSQSVNGKNTIDIILQAEATGLSEVVVVGYGTQKKKDLTGAISTVSAADFARVPAANPVQAIRGRVSGLNITGNSGAPGDNASVRIRGTQSINGTNSPIYVVDGMITSDINSINPNDIESVSVLKDASSTAIYGARAANGVIIIQTKSGKGKTTPEITFNAYAGVQGNSNHQLKLLNSEQFLELLKESYQNAGIAVPWNESDLDYYKNSDGSLVNTNWLDLITRTGIIQKYDLGVAGGSERSNYNVSAGYLTNKGQVIGTNYSKFTLHLNSDYDIKDWIHFGTSLNLYSSNTNGYIGADADKDAYTYALTKVPLTRAYDKNGDYAAIHNTVLEHQYLNPIWAAKEIDHNNNKKGLLGNIHLKFDLLKGLDFTVNANMDWHLTTMSDFTPGIDPHYHWEGSNKNAVTKRDERTMHWVTDYTLHYNRIFNDIHSLDVLVGYSVEESNYEYLEGYRSNTPNNEIRYLNAGDPTSQLNENGMNDWAFLSQFGRINYNYKDKYLFTGSVRRDGSSRLAKGDPYGIFPSAAVAWRISQEDFMQDIDFLNDLKIRASFGSVGNVLSVGQYATVPNLTQWNYVLDEQPALGYTLATSINPSLKWETTIKKDIGLDATLFNSRLSATIDYYIADTKDLLFQEHIPLSTGYSNDPYINAGKVRNTGIEVSIGYRGDLNDWHYDVSVNLSHEHNEVVDLGGRDLHTQGLLEGYPVKSFFGYKANGIIYTEDDLTKNPQMSGKRIGDIWFEDVNGKDSEGNLTGEPDGNVNSDDRTIIGRKYPSLTYGAFASIGYKNWTLQVQLEGIQGMDKNILTPQKGVFNYFASWAMNNSILLMDRYEANKNPTGKWPMVDASDKGHTRDFSSFWLRDASYLRVSNVNLNYNFPQAILKSFIKYLGVYISVDNLYTFTKFPGPDVANASDSFSEIPQPRVFTFGIKTTF